MVDIATHFSSLNRLLQGNNKLCHDTYSAASVFVRKLNFWKKQLASGVSTLFPTLSNHRVSVAYNKLICSLIDELEGGIKRMNSFLPQMKIFATPMAIDVITAPDNFQLKILHRRLSYSF